MNSGNYPIKIIWPSEATGWLTIAVFENGSIATSTDQLNWSPNLIAPVPLLTGGKNPAKPR